MNERRVRHASARLTTALALASLLFASTAHAITYTTVVLLGDTDPGTGQPFDSLVRPLVNDVGDILIAGSSAGFVTGLWIADQASLLPVMQDGETDPDTGLEWGSPRQPRISNDGEVSAKNVVTGDLSNMFESVWRGPAGNFDLVAIEGDEDGELAAIPTGPDFMAFSDGRVVFRATVNPFPFPGGLFYGSADGPLEQIALVGQIAPGTAVQFDGISEPDVANDVGGVLFDADLTGPTTTDTGVWLATPAATSLLLREGDALPGLGGETATSVFALGISDGGEAAVYFIGNAGSRGYLTGTPGALSVAVQDDDPAPVPGQPDAFFLQLNASAVQMSGTGDLVFQAAVDGANISLSTSASLFAIIDDALFLVARRGDVAPGTGGATFDEPEDPSINDLGQVVFVAETSDGEEGIFALHDPGLEAVVRTGEMFDVGGGDLREVVEFTIADDSGAGEKALGDDGLLAFQLFFDDGTNGIFAAQLVPEPSVALLHGTGLTALAALVHRRRRR